LLQFLENLRGSDNLAFKQKSSQNHNCLYHKVSHTSNVEMLNWISWSLILVGQDIRLCDMLFRLFQK